MREARRGWVSGLACAALVLAAACSRTPEPLQLAGPAMGTTYGVSIPRLPEGVQRRSVENAVADVLREAADHLSGWNEQSELVRLNATASTDWQPVSPVLFGSVAQALALSRATKGTFDVTAGVAVLRNKKVCVVKEDLPSDNFIKKHYIGLKQEITKANIVIGHTRLATQGHQRDNNNNHPIVGEKFVMVHNGTCPSMDRIKDYPYKGTVDSEILLSHIEKKGLKEGLKALKGSAAVAIISADEPNTIYLWRHNNPLWLAYNPEKKTLFFASTEDILREGLADLLEFFSSYHMRQLPEDCLYKITCNPFKIEFVEEIEPVGFGYTYSKKGAKGNSYTYPSYYYGEGGWGEDEYYAASHRSISVDKDTPKDKVEAIGDIKKYTNIYKDIQALRWDTENKIYTADKVVTATSTAARYYFHGPSHDLSFSGRNIVPYPRVPADRQYKSSK